MPGRKKHQGPQARWPSLATYDPREPRTVDGACVMERRVCPFVTYVHFKRRRGWYCEGCQSDIEGPDHFVSEQHRENLRWY